MIRWLLRILAVTVAAYLIGFALFAFTLPRAAGDERTDAIVVLTGQGGGRLERGFELLRLRRAGRMLISGVERSVRPEELIAVYGVDEALFRCCVALGREAVDTRSNAEEVAAWARRRGVRSLRLVTNDFHMPRARYEVGRRLDPAIRVVADAVPTPFEPWRALGEYHKLLGAFAAGMLGI